VRRLHLPAPIMPVSATGKQKLADVPIMRRTDADITVLMPRDTPVLLMR